eukprot:GHVL01004804.1.p1 GENE.GHVL01004804.1~~GHVL01004804.1.p1  ORF type:complete len:303 (+),score=83.88 GHVL01004804.1:26-910(+)
MSKDNTTENAEDFDVDFEFTEPDESDYHCYKRMIENLLPEQWAHAELAEIITQQVNIGTSIKAEGADGWRPEESFFAFITALNFRQFQKNRSFIQINQYINKIKKHSDSENRAIFDKIMEDPKNNLGLIINERVTNLPNDLIPSLWGSLEEDITWSQNVKDCNEEEEKEKKFYYFSHYILLTCFFLEDSNKTMKKDDSNSVKTAARQYPHFEDEFFVKEKILEIVYPIHSNKRFEDVADEKGKRIKTTSFKQYGLIILFSSSKLKDIKNKIQKMTPPGAADSSTGVIPPRVVKN